MYIELCGQVEHQGESVDISTVGSGEATELWLRWKRAYETVRATVVAETTAASGVSEPELSVLVCLHESGGSLRQNALGWDRTRLSHLLTRMVNRGYVVRDKLPNGVEVALCPEGRHVIDATLPILETATRRHLLDRLGPDAGESEVVLAGARRAATAQAGTVPVPVSVASIGAPAGVRADHPGCAGVPGTDAAALTQRRQGGGGVR